ncbi:polysaccharide deacetylase family protein [Streptococcus loxodontisalivarius]|uniref:Peptidoglycan/xylan/chitin deacetylase (PgdA/CDA1 family) n=1 Tax=Streptococcus loxodontisalivarius TaxID=1349415 RepID=A0ABS2PT01_9STRE|nr:polysaccharide deacetylase family protein [Streptococcus loxodontisalivarius]MBM7643164.1 peptidoglycan/xylan/chitin deacetylase (PgdA/CDA1 family) [Streptococcus loxodontisalivarius]
MKNRNLYSIINGVLLVLILITIGLIGFTLYKPSQKASQSDKVKMSQTDKTEEDSSESSETSESSSESINPSQLMPGTNHNYHADSYAYSTSEIRSYMDGTATTDQKIVFLTFDDGPDTVITPQILDVLAQYQVPATFFLVGNNVTDETKSIIERQISEGHAIAAHSMSHNFNLLYPNRVGNTDQIVYEATQTQAVLKTYLGDDFQTNVFRYPGGHMSWTGLENADASLANLGISWMDWNTLAGDAEPLSKRPTTSEAMMQYIQSSTQYFHDTPIKVLLMHDIVGKELTLQTLPQIIQYYKDQGYTFGVLE